MAIRRRIHHGFKANVSAGAGAILDHGLAKPLRKRLCHLPRDRVVCASGSDPDDQTNRLGRIIERERR